MKKQQLKKLKLKTNTISNLQSNALKGGASCEAPCQGGTGCCNGGTRNSCDKSCRVSREHGHLCICDGDNIYIIRP